MCPNYEPEGQGRGSTFRVCHALKKIAILLNKSLIPSHLKWPALYNVILYLQRKMDEIRNFNESLPRYYQSQNLKDGNEIEI